MCSTYNLTRVLNIVGVETLMEAIKAWSRLRMSLTERMWDPNVDSGAICFGTPAERGRKKLLCTALLGYPAAISAALERVKIAFSHGQDPDRKSACVDKLLPSHASSDTNRYGAKRSNGHRYFLNLGSNRHFMRSCLLRCIREPSF